MKKKKLSKVKRILYLRKKLKRLREENLELKKQVAMLKNVTVVELRERNEELSESLEKLRREWDVILTEDTRNP